MAHDSNHRTDLVLAGIILFVLVLIAADVATDLRNGASLTHVMGEGVMLFFCGIGVILVLRRFVKVSEQARRLAVDLSLARKESEHWRAESSHLLSGLGAAIDIQFKRWSLSPAESAVALFLLKGLSHKEIAELREVSERTVRQQSREVYRKSGLTGRAALSAYFLEDLLLPDGSGQGRAGENAANS